MKSRYALLTDAERQEFLSIESDLRGWVYILDPGAGELLLSPPKNREHRLQDGYPAVLLTPQEAKKLAEEIIGICEVNFGMEGSV